MKQKAVLFGAGGVGSQALSYFGFKNVECFIDNNVKRVGTKLQGKIIKNFENLLTDYANKSEYRIYITTDTFFNELADQLNENDVFNYSFFHDYIPGYVEVERFVGELVDNATKNVAIIGTSNVTELFISAVEESIKRHKYDVSIEIFDYHGSRKVGRDYFGYMVQDANALIKENQKFDIVFFTITEERTYGRTGVTDAFEGQVIDAREAIKYVSMEYLKEKEGYRATDPQKILSASRMDIIPRFLLAMMISQEDDNAAIRSLYARTILFASNAEEKLGVFSERAKIGVESHINALEQLVQNMKKEGYKKESYIPLANGVVYDGAHRLAAALALNETVWVRDIQNNPPEFKFSWFEKNGFSVADKIAILRGYADLYSMCNLFVVFYPVFCQYEYIIAQIEKSMTVVGQIEVDFSDNFYAFKNIINDIYASYESNFDMIRKIKDLMMFPMKLRVILVSDEGCEQDNIYAISTQVKLKLRDQLTYDVPSEAYCTIHSANSLSEFNDLKNIVLSNNNINQLKRRVNTEYKKIFLDKLSEVKQFCVENEINREEVCVVANGVMEVMGICDSNKLTIIMSSKVRKRLGISSGHQVSDNIEIAAVNCMKDKSGKNIKEDSVLFNIDKHFWFCGVKFCNIEFVKYCKKYTSSNDQMEKCDLRMIECFEDYSRYSSEDSMLREQMRLKYE